MTDGTPTLRSLLRPYRALLAIAFVAMLAESAANLLEPWPLKVIFDYIIGQKTPPAWLTALGGPSLDPLHLLKVAAAAVVIIAALSASSSYTQKYLASTVGKRVGYDLRHLLYHHVQRLSLSFYERRQTGDMVVRLTSDIEAIEDLVTSAVLGITLDVLTLTGMLGVMFYLNWRFSLIALSVAPILFSIVFRFTRRIKKAARAVKSKESELASIVQESISSARVIKAFAREDFEERRFDDRSQESVSLSLKARSLKALLAPLVDIVLAVGTCLVLWVGVRLVLGGDLTAGALLVFVLYLDKMYKPMKDLSKMTDTLSKAAVGFERIREVLAVESQVRELPEAQPAPRFAGAIDFDRVTFGYRPEEPVLRDLTLSIAAGQRVALVGPTGSGKSTLIGLVPRLYDVQSGQIRIDGRDVRRFTLQSLRDQVAFVLQDTVLFRATIAENIAYGRAGATRDEVMRAAALARADEFIARMPQGYDTLIGERGETLSGGQRQRIAIARAIVRNAPILLLDEPSASLDPEAEALVAEAMQRLLAGRTSITIAHRLETVVNADRIYVLDHGQICEAGTHDELIARAGLYARLYRIQFRHAARPLAAAG